MSKQFARLMQHRRKRKKSDTAELAAQLAPLEEQDREAAEQKGAVLRPADNGQPQHERGTIVVDTNHLVVPRDVVEAEEKGLPKTEPVVLVIVVLMLIFIAYIAWEISKMPAP